MGLLNPDFNPKNHAPYSSYTSDPNYKFPPKLPNVPWWLVDEPNETEYYFPGTGVNRWNYIQNNPDVQKTKFYKPSGAITPDEAYEYWKGYIKERMPGWKIITENEIALDEPNKLAMFWRPKYAIKIPKTNNPPWWLKSEPSKPNGSSQYRWNWVQDTYPYMTLNSWYFPPRVVTTGEAENIYKDKLKLVHPDWVATETVKSTCVIS